MLNDQRNEAEWSRPGAIAAPTLNVTKVGGLIAGVITAVGVTIGPLLATLRDTNSGVAIAIIAMVAVAILAFALIASVDIITRGRASVAAGGVQAAPGVWVKVHGRGDDEFLVLDIIGATATTPPSHYIVTRHDEEPQLVPAPAVQGWIVR